MNNDNRLPELIGISGTFASGKDTVASHLVLDYNYTHVSTGDMVRKVARSEYDSVERPVLQKVATAHRLSDGAGYFVEEALREPRPLVVSGIRSLGEAKALKAAGGTLVFVDAPLEVRFERATARERDGEEKLSLEEFRESEEREWHVGESDADFNLRDIKAMADIVIENTSSVDEFISDVYAKLAE